MSVCSGLLMIEIQFFTDVQVSGKTIITDNRHTNSHWIYY